MAMQETAGKLPSIVLHVAPHVISVPAIDGIVVKSVAGYCTEVTYD